ncbi:MAG: hypothetical protein JWN32_4535, partial [Solirubrobacterales bacterium]|nr:hypothetical protein [Solirubrobacterales bacterium]
MLCGLALVIGRGVLAASGYERWSWLAAPVGCALVVVAAEVGARAPGGATTGVVVVLALAAAGLLLPRLTRSSIGWPPLEGLGVAAVVLVALATPFVANARFGLLGVGFNNDPSFHILWAEEFRNHAEGALAPLSPGYPVGPHAVVAVLAELLGTSVDRTFDGLLIATPVLIALTALEWLRDLDRSRRWLVAALAGLSYLVASWYAQAAFKEPLLALFVLAFALVLADAVRTRVAQVARVAVPAGVLLVGILYTYGYLGVLWPAATVAVWLALAFTVGGAWREVRVLRRYARPVATVVAVVAGLVVVGVLGDAHRILDFVNALGLSPATGGGGIPVDNIGNLVGQLHLLEGFGVWLGEDFRLVAAHPHRWPVLALLVCAGGLLWALWRRDLVLPAALIACAAIAYETRQTQSAYVAAKALVVAAPFVVLVASRPLLHRLGARGAWRRASTWGVGAIAFLYLLLSFQSSYLALRAARVGPSADFRELRALRPVLGQSPTLDMVFDDFFRWNLLGAQVTIPGLVGPVGAPYSPDKAWQLGEPLDFDSFDAATLDRFRYVITSRTPAQSQPPPNFHVVARSARYAVWRRVGPTPAHRVLPESGSFG